MSCHTLSNFRQFKCFTSKYYLLQIVSPKSCTDPSLPLQSSSSPSLHLPSPSNPSAHLSYLPPFLRFCPLIHTLKWPSRKKAFFSKVLCYGNILHLKNRLKKFRRVSRLGSQDLIAHFPERLLNQYVRCCTSIILHRTRARPLPFTPNL